jgi:hypothetical protein
MLRADTLVTPINDSFVDLDLIGEVDPETYKVRRPSFYAELVWNSRTQRAKTTAQRRLGAARNRLQHIEARTCAASARRWTSFPAASASGSFRASASASSTASCSPRA